MIKDPQVRKIVEGGTGRYLTRGQKFERFLFYLLVIAVVGLGGLYLVTNGIARKADAASSNANTSIQSQCLFYKGVADTSGPTVPPTLTKIGLSILVGARVAYEGLNCDLGELPPAAPQVAAQLPIGFH